MQSRHRHAILTADKRLSARRGLVCFSVCLTALLSLAACSDTPSSKRVATDDIHLSLIAMRHNDHLLVQVTLSPDDDRDNRVHLDKDDHLRVTLNDQVHTLEQQWNGVYSNQIDYEEGVLQVDLLRQGSHASALDTHLQLPVSPEFHSPGQHALFHTQSDAAIPLRWTGIATENGEYELRCTNRNDGTQQFTGSFAAVDKQRASIPVDQLMQELIESNRRGFCEAVFTLRGISTTGSVSTELAGGDVLFESNVSRNVIIRHNALF